MSAESKSLINRLRGTYPVGPIMESGEPEFGYRDMFGPNVTAPGIDLEAAAHIEKMEGELAALRLGKAVATVVKRGADRQWMSEALGELPDGSYSLFLRSPSVRTSAEPAAIPAILFDTHAVYSAMDVKGHSRTSTENVGDVLDAVVKILNQ